MILHYKPDLVLNSGVAGSLTEKLNVLGIAIGSDCVQHDFDLSPLGMGGTNGGITTKESAAAYAVFGNGGKYQFTGSTVRQLFFCYGIDYFGNKMVEFK